MSLARLTLTNNFSNHNLFCYGEILKYSNMQFVRGNCNVILLYVIYWQKLFLTLLSNHSFLTSFLRFYFFLFFFILTLFLTKSEDQTSTVIFKAGLHQHKNIIGCLWDHCWYLLELGYFKAAWIHFNCWIGI